MKLHCKCGVDYEGHHASKYCPQCKAAGLKVKTSSLKHTESLDIADSAMVDTLGESMAATLHGVMADAVHVGSIPPGGSFPNEESGDMLRLSHEEFEDMKRAIFIEFPLWHEYGMCDGGEELVPNWILSQGKLVKVGPPASQKALQLMWDAFQIKTCNRVPILGDFDYGKGR